MAIRFLETQARVSIEVNNRINVWVAARGIVARHQLPYYVVTQRATSSCGSCSASTVGSLVGSSIRRIPFGPLRPNMWAHKSSHVGSGGDEPQPKVERTGAGNVPLVLNKRLHLLSELEHVKAILASQSLDDLRVGFRGRLGASGRLLIYRLWRGAQWRRYRRRVV